MIRWFTIAALLGGVVALQWPDTLPDQTVLQVCVGSDIHLPFNYSLAPGETVEDVKWIYQAEGRDGEMVAIMAGTNFMVMPAFSGRVQLEDGQAEIVVSEAGLLDTGHYSVEVIASTAVHALDRFDRTVFVQVVDPPSTEGEALHVQQTDGAVYDTTAARWTLQLTCGVFSDLGFPPVDIVWTTPQGQQLSSSSHDNGTFSLLVPTPPSEGNYSCSLPPSSPATRCLPPHSPLQEGAAIHLDQVKVSFALLQAQMVVESSQLKNELAQLRTENAQMRTENDQLKDNLTRLQTDSDQLRTDLELENQYLRRDVEELNTTVRRDVEELNTTVRRDVEELNTTVISETGRLGLEVAAVRNEWRSETAVLRSRLASATQRVSFHGRLQNTLDTFRGRLHSFTRDLVTEGGAFDASSGVFTTPVNGTCFFGGAAATSSSAQYVDMYLVKDGTRLSRALGGQYSVYRAMGSCNVVLQLTVGERVWLESAATNTYYYLESTTFSGFLISADE